MCISIGMTLSTWLANFTAWAIIGAVYSANSHAVFRSSVVVEHLLLCHLGGFVSVRVVAGPVEFYRGAVSVCYDRAYCGVVFSIWAVGDVHQGDAEGYHIPIRGGT